MWFVLCLALLVLVAEAHTRTNALKLSARSVGLHFRQFRVARPSTALKDSKTYLVEFKGMQPALRLSELTDAYHAISGREDEDGVGAVLHIEPVISTFKSGGPLHPVCGYVKFPGEEVAAAVAKRCALVRSIVEVWGNALTPEEVGLKARESYDEIIAPIFPTTNTADENSWRVNFRRYGRSGRSGLDFPEKRKLLQTFNPILKSISGNVDLTNARHDLIYLEDWSTFHDEVGETLSNQLSGTSTAAAVAAESAYTPLKSILGRIIAEGQNVQYDFDIKRRPYIGTTTMDPVVSHVAANAALIVPGQRVLDPFCGTGSLLLASAFLGAEVVGSDIDFDCLGLSDENELADKDRSKNSRFKRAGVSSQLEKSMVDNFEFYGLKDKLVALLGMDAAMWATPLSLSSSSSSAAAVAVAVAKDKNGAVEGGGNNNNPLPSLPVKETMRAATFGVYSDSISTINQRDDLDALGLFDAIVTDPPYSRREKAHSSSTSTSTSTATAPDGTPGTAPMGDTHSTYSTLFAIAARRLKPGGRLVFWLPTDSNISEEDARTQLRVMLSEAGTLANSSMVLQRTTKEELNKSLWRWMCVYKRK